MRASPASSRALHMPAECTGGPALPHLHRQRAREPAQAARAGALDAGIILQAGRAGQSRAEQGESGSALLHRSGRRAAACTRRACPHCSSCQRNPSALVPVQHAHRPTIQPTTHTTHSTRHHQPRPQAASQPAHRPPTSQPTNHPPHPTSAPTLRNMFLWAISTRSTVLSSNCIWLVSSTALRAAAALVNSANPCAHGAEQRGGGGQAPGRQTGSRRR
jgi:hypothetical protein